MKFSVVVPVYNVEKYLKICVDSILNQTYNDFELLLINDGSTDNSAQIISDYEKIDNRVKGIHKTNGGQSTARNLGVEKASGDYVVFLDSDDFISDNNYLSDLCEVLTKDTEVVMLRYNKYFEDGRISDLGISFDGIDCLNKGQMLYQLVSRDAFFCSCWSKCISLKFLKDNGIRFDENLRCEDMDWFYQVVEKAQNFALIDKPYVNYRQRQNSVTTTVSEKTAKDYLFILSKWQARFYDLPEGVEKEALLSSLSKLYCNLLVSYVRSKKILKPLKKQIFAFKPLLKHNLNPRTRKVYKFSRVLGLNLTCVALKFFDKVKK